MSEDTKKIIYSMVGVNKNYNGKPIIKDISLSYFYGAKIGVLGLNGSGKSTLLRIMAGVDKEFNGETMLSDGYSVGFLEQEPLIDCAKTVREVVEEGVQETVDLLKEFEEINAAFADPDADMEKLCDRQAVTAIAHGNLGDEAQMRCHQLLRGFTIAMLFEAFGEHIFLFLRQDREFLDFRHITIEAEFAPKRGYSCDGFCHFWSTP